MTLEQDLLACAEDAKGLEEDLALTKSALAAATAVIVDKDAEIADLTHKLADCLGGVTPEPEPEPEPIPTGTDFGACATKGGSASQVPVKWGKGAALRTFGASNSFAAPSAVPDAGTRHHSWKPAIGSPINGTNVAAACINMREGDFVEVWHEADVKANSGSLTTSQCQQIKDMKNWFFDAVQVVRPDLFVAHTMGAWIFDDRSGSYPGAATDPGKATYWSNVKADVIGIDCDGYASTTKYPDFTSCIKNVKDYIAKNGFGGWAVPEFIHPRLSSDPTGQVRANFFTSNGTKFRAGGAVYVTLFDYDYRPGQEVILGSPEYAAWKAFTL